MCGHTLLNCVSEAQNAALATLLLVVDIGDINKHENKFPRAGLPP